MRAHRRGFALAIAATIGLVGSLAAKTPGEKAPTCGDYGTSVHFEATPADAAKQAKLDEKLVMVLHVSGFFEDPQFT
ncbi:MAG TPA: hypothetical protein VHR66_30870 [Gemmataceae bacterium]|jgi:hypothetical protein|nr:hypothetical protein [Gemmataceae bacterium]